MRTTTFAGRPRILRRLTPTRYLGDNSWSGTGQSPGVWLAQASVSVACKIKNYLRTV